MKRTIILCLLIAGIIVAFSGVALAKNPNMKPVKKKNTWKPHRIYKNYVGVCITPYDEVSDWDIGIFTTKKGDEPHKKYYHGGWVNGQSNDFTLAFDKTTGRVDFTIGDAPTVTHDFEEYAYRGMEDLHIIAQTHNNNPFSYTYITNLQVDGNDWNFVDIDGLGKIYTYTTISGLECESFVLTGTVHNNWMGRFQKKQMQMFIRFGEACDLAGQSKLICDLSANGMTDLIDYALFAPRWRNNCNEPNWCDGRDFDTSGAVDTNDLIFIASEWLEKNYGGGVGIEGNPFLIYTAEELHSIGLLPGDWGAHFKLMADIDLSGYTGNSFNTIGNQAYAEFTGVFDGDNRAIINFTQGDANNPVVGFFRYVGGEDAVIKNLRMINPNVATEGPDIAGVLVGQLGAGTILNCSIEGGAIAGYTGEALEIGANYIGGLIGENIGGIVINCLSDCDVIGYDYVGGLIGRNVAGTVNESFADGNTISGHDRVGGLIGKNDQGNISNSYSHKGVFAHDMVGGLIGEDIQGTIENCYSTGYVTENSDDRGGLIGKFSGVATNCFWDYETGGMLNDNGVGSPEWTADMQAETTFASAGWDFTTPLWTIYEGTDYPMLLWEVLPFPSPMNWASPPQAIGAYSVAMTATEAQAWDGGGASYHFINITDPNHDSFWQLDEVYVDTGLEEMTEYTYAVRAKDWTANQYETEFSAGTSVTTPADATIPEPNVMTWASVPTAIGDYVTMTATEAVDDSGEVEYYFANVIDPNHDSNWQDSSTFEDSNLIELAEYTYKVKVRDLSAAKNETGWSESLSVTALDITSPTPEPNWASVPAATGSFSIAMTATVSTDQNGVEYYFNNITDST